MTAFNEIGAPERREYRLHLCRPVSNCWPGSRTVNRCYLFATGAFAFAIERRATEPHLAEMVRLLLTPLLMMTQAFLMVESARIDSAGHSNLIRQSVYETLVSLRKPSSGFGLPKRTLIRWLLSLLIMKPAVSWRFRTHRLK